MLRLLGCVAKLAAAAALVVLVVVAISMGRGSGDDPSIDGSPDPTVALDVLERYQRLIAGESSELALSGREIESMLLYQLPGFTPEQVSPRGVTIAEGQVHVDLEVTLNPPTWLAQYEWVVRTLPEAVPVQVSGPVTSGGPNDGALFIAGGSRVWGIPFPRLLLTELIDSYVPADRRGVPPGSVRLPLPPGIRAAYIQDEQLILSRN